MTLAFTHFVEPLSACFVPRPGQDFELFAKQLMEDLKPYPEPVLSEAAREVRRKHPFPTWPTIAECLKAVREAAARRAPPDPPDIWHFDEPGPEERERMMRKFNAIKAELAANMAMDKPHPVLQRGIK